MQLISRNIDLDAHGARFKEFNVSPFFYTLEKIPWDIFMTFHYKGRDFNRDDEWAEKNRRSIIFRLINDSRKTLSLSKHDLQFFGTTEKKWGRCHTHTLIHIKRKAGKNQDLVRNTIQAHIPWDIVTIPEKSTRENANQIVNDPIAVSAYISKFNGNEIDAAPIHFSRDFVNFVSNYNEMSA